MNSQLNKPTSRSISNASSQFCAAATVASSQKTPKQPGKKSKATDEVADCLLILQKLAGASVVNPDAAECKQIASHISDVEDGRRIADYGRHVAYRLCQHPNPDYRQSGILLLKELGKRGDPYAKLLHARLRWEKGPLKNHQYAQELVDELSRYAWPEWPEERAFVALGELFRLKGLLLLKGEKVMHDAGLALSCFKFAADKYLDGHAAWLAAQFYARYPIKDYAHIAKPQAAAYAHYMTRAKEQGYHPGDEAADKGA